LPLPDDVNWDFENPFPITDRRRWRVDFSSPDANGSSGDPIFATDVLADATTGGGTGTGDIGVAIDTGTRIVTVDVVYDGPIVLGDAPAPATYRIPLDGFVDVPPPAGAI